MPCFINLPLSWLREQPAWADWFVAGRIAPELGLDDASLTLPDSWHRDMAARFRDAGLPCAVHLPFLGVDAGNPDPLLADLAKDALQRGAELTRLYGAQHMIGHPYFRIKMSGLCLERDLARWLEQSRAVWPELPRIAGAPLFLENTYEASPDAIATLVAALQPEVTDGPAAGGCTDGPGIGVCFDVGHWHAFAKKSRPEELDPWLDAFCPFAMHLHLHDNDGNFDQHRGLGCGDVPFDALFARLRARGKTVTVTLEPHDTEALVASARWLEANPGVAAAVAWERPRLEALPLAEIERNIVNGKA